MLHSIQGDEGILLYPQLFQQGIEMIKGYKADMRLCADAKPVFKKS